MHFAPNSCNQLLRCEITICHIASGNALPYRANDLSVGRILTACSGSLRCCDI